MNGATAGTTWRPGASLPVARCRADMLRRTRQFFDEHALLEVTTPALSAAAVSDLQIESIGLRLVADPAKPYYLHTSPEYAMKRLLCAGWPDIYQVCPVYRDGESGPHHQPEFTMVEWYRHGIGLQAMMQHTLEFLERLIDGKHLRLRPQFLSYRDAFLRYAGVDPLDASLGQLRDASGADTDLAHSLGERRDDWLDLVLSSRVASALPPGQLTVLHHYPASQAALAQLCPQDPRLADRYEVFFGDLELANGYAELTDAAEQRRRFGQDQAKRQQRGRARRPLDNAFLDALDAGLPPCCGVAVGFDRLVMINSEAGDLAGVQTFPVIAPT